MGTGVLGNVDLSATTVTDVYTVPVSTISSVNINVCNRNDTTVLVRLALSDTTGTQDDSEFIEYDTPLIAYGVLERTGVTLNAGKIITAYSDTANVSVVVTGVEESV
jgi:hypothetical protein